MPDLWELPHGATALVYFGPHAQRVSPWFEIRCANQSRTLPEQGFYCQLDRATGEIGPPVHSPVLTP